MSKQLLDYSRIHKTLLKPHRDFVIYLGGGMAVKLYLTERGVSPLPPKVASTKDYDFVFSVHRPLENDQEIDKYARKMYFIMTKFLFSFLNPVSLKVKSYRRKSSIPAIGKKTYHVIQFIKDGDDFVDCTLSYTPGITRHKLNTEISNKIGLPIKKLNAMKKDILTVLAGSFYYKKIMARNPLGKDKPEKGRRNVARVSALHKLKVSSPKSVPTTELLQAIRSKNAELAVRKAKRVIEILRKKNQ